MECKKFAIIGGDKRNIYLSKLLAKDGHIVRNYAFDGYDIEIIKECENLYQAIEGADYIIGPTPCSHNGYDFNLIYSNRCLSVDDVFRLIKPNQIFFAGHVKENVFTVAEKYQVRCVDILKREELALLNAIPTAFPKEVYHTASNSRNKKILPGPNQPSQNFSNIIISLQKRFYTHLFASEYRTCRVL